MKSIMTVTGPPLSESVHAEAKVVVVIVVIVLVEVIPNKG